MKYSFTVDTPTEETVDSAKRRVKVRRELAHALGCDSRPLRQYAAQVLLDVAEEDPAAVQEFESEILDAMNRPEPMTCYHALRMVELLVGEDARVVERAFDDIEACLHEESGMVRLSAFRALARFGSTTERRSERAWPSMADALRCYHGDTEFVAMMNALTDMLDGKVSDQVKIEAAQLFEFDVQNTDNFLARKARQIVEFAEGVEGYEPGASLRPESKDSDDED